MPYKPKGVFPLPAIADPVAEIVILGTQGDGGGGGSTKCQNVFYYRLTTVGGPINKTNLATIFNTTIITPLLVATHQRYAVNAVRIRMVNDVTDVPGVIANAGVGAIATDAEPSDDTVVMNILSATRGKMCRGRKFFGGSAEIDTTLDVLNAAGLAHWTPVRDALDDVMVDAGGNTWTPFLLSKAYSKLTTPVSIKGVNIVKAVLLKTIGTLRKRRSLTVYAA